MPGACRARPRARSAVTALAAAAVAMTLLLGACGGEEEDGASTEAQDVTAEEAEVTTETTAQPPPEAAPEDSSGDGGGRTSGGGSEGSLAQEAATAPQSCPDVIITPNSSNGLFAVEAEGITCEDAAAALEAWGSSGYPGGGPPGFSCEEISQGESGGSARLSCQQDASGAVVEFDTGI